MVARFFPPDSQSDGAFTTRESGIVLETLIASPPELEQTVILCGGGDVSAISRILDLLVGGGDGFVLVRVHDGVHQIPKFCEIV